MEMCGHVWHGPVSFRLWHIFSSVTRVPYNVRSTEVTITITCFEKECAHTVCLQFPVFLRKVGDYFPKHGNALGHCNEVTLRFL
jgi:hypothetical protein